jgi:hypothetical protein
MHMTRSKCQVEVTRITSTILVLQEIMVVVEERRNERNEFKMKNLPKLIKKKKVFFLKLIFFFM